MRFLEDERSFTICIQFESDSHMSKRSELHNIVLWSQLSDTMRKTGSITDKERVIV